LVTIDGLESGATLLDLGCGLGDFKRFLDRRGLAVEYTGWDICAPLVDRARALHPDARFEVRDLLADPPAERFDFVVCSGALNLLLPDHEAWVRRMVRAMFALTRRALAFNLLSARHLHDHPFDEDPYTYFYADPVAVLALCLELSPQAVVDHLEVPHMVTAFVYRSNARPVARVRDSLDLGTRFGPEHMAIVEHCRAIGLLDDLIDYLHTLEPAPEVFEQIGRAAYSLGDHDRQIEAYRRAVDLAPRSSEMLDRLAAAYIDAGHPADAIDPLERACELAPDDEALAERLARCRGEAEPV
jgi:tetratricopeptide (TPR) repeat protein